MDPSPKTITAAKDEENYKLTRAATPLSLASSCHRIRVFCLNMVIKKKNVKYSLRPFVNRIYL